MESVIENALRVIIASKEIECADRIVYETGIYKVVVVVLSIFSLVVVFSKVYWSGTIVLIYSEIAI